MTRQKRVLEAIAAIPDEAWADIDYTIGGQLVAVLANKSGTLTLRFPTRWPWAHAFTNTLTAIRALPAPSG